MATHADSTHEARAYGTGPSEAPDYAGQQLALYFDIFFPYTHAARWWGARKEEGLGFQSIEVLGLPLLARTLLSPMERCCQHKDVL